MKSVAKRIEDEDENEDEDDIQAQRAESQTWNRSV
jgi:hypothetical protein